MKQGIQPDLLHRLVEADRRGRCVAATTRSDARRLNAAVSRGLLLSPAQGVYASPQLWADKKPTQRDLAVAHTLQELHPQWVFCGVTAALAHGLAVSFSLTGEVHVAVSRRSHSRPHGTHGVHRHVVEGDDFVEIDGLRVTSAERTVFDCVRSCGFREGLAVADSALHKKLMTQDHLLEACVKMSNRFTGRSRAIETVRLADGHAESGGESVARAIMIERGFRLPELQHEVTDPLDSRCEYRADFFWNLGEHIQVIGELDGHEKYVDPSMTGGRSIIDVLTDERLRESRISSSGARIMRFSYANMLNRAYFTRLLCSFGIPRDAEIPWVALRKDDPEAYLSRHHRLFLGKWMAYAPSQGIAMPVTSVA